MKFERKKEEEFDEFRASTLIAQPSHFKVIRALKLKYFKCKIIFN